MAQQAAPLRHNLACPHGFEDTFIMCRFTTYLGPPVWLSAILLEPSHSLIRQSTSAKERDEPLNGDGFGVGWYSPEEDLEPAVFRSITPAWNNRNLHNLARVVASSCIFAHVRAATQASGVNEANCHPFRFGRYLFMHNGDIPEFRKVRRRLLNSVCDAGFDNIFGSTDSEHIFAILIDEILKREAPLTAAQLGECMITTVKRIEMLVHQAGIKECIYLNLALTDGEHVIVARYASEAEYAPSLYYFLGDLYRSLADTTPRRRPCETLQSVVVSSEKLTEHRDWYQIEGNHMIIASGSRSPEVIPIAL